MIRLVLFLLICYLIYAFYKTAQKPQLEPKIKNLGKAKVVPKRFCPSPKTFLDYIEGKIQSGKKEEICKHIDSCKNCQDALQAVFNMPTQEELKQRKASASYK
ncbi:MAG: hypothetical protein ABH843_04065 [Candidatus Omnitrophota bacterium]